MGRTTFKDGFHAGSCENFRRAPIKYLVSLYFAVYTLTGIGYGDVSAVTRSEYVLCVVCIMSTSILWAFLIGNFCAIVASMDKHPARFRSAMDDLNSMLSETDLDPELCARVRDYFSHSRNLMRTRDYHELDMLMSVGLRGEVAGVVSQKWLTAVWYFRDSSVEFMRELSMMMEPLMFAPWETVESGNSLLIIQRGLVMLGGKMLTRGDHVGHEFIVRRDEERYALDAESGEVDAKVSPSAFTYVEVLELRQEDLTALFPLFPREARRIRVASCWLVTKLALMKWARQHLRRSKAGRLKLEKKGRSFSAALDDGAAANLSPTSSKFQAGATKRRSTMVHNRARTGRTLIADSSLARGTTLGGLVISPSHHLSERQNDVLGGGIFANAASRSSGSLIHCAAVAESAATLSRVARLREAARANSEEIAALVRLLGGEGDEADDPFDETLEIA